MSDLNPNLLFILGSQRSGTTLLRLILESHSKIHAIDEPTCYNLLAEGKDLLSNLNTKKPNIVFKTPLLTEQMNEPFFSDASISFLIPNFFQNCTRIFMVRDVRDTIASMLSLKQGTSTWLKIWAAKSVDFWEKTIPSFHKEFAKDLILISKSKEKIFSYASLYWKVKTMSYFKYDKSLTFLVKYEDLVSTPESVLKGLLHFINIEWEDNLLKHHLLEHSGIGKNGLLVGDNDPKKPISKNSIGSYKDKLSKTQIEEIMKISKTLMVKIGYDVE